MLNSTQLRNVILTWDYGNWPWTRLSHPLVAFPWIAGSWNARTYCTYKAHAWKSRWVTTAGDVPGVSEAWTEQ